MSVSSRATWFVAVALGTGCSTLRLEIDRPLDSVAVESFRVGETTRTEVLATLGAPTAVARSGDGCAFVYESVHLDEDQFGPSLSSVGSMVGFDELGLLKLSLGDSDSDRSAAVLLFDRSRVLSGKSLGSWEEVFGRGGSLQFFVALDRVVDSGRLRDPERALSWGDDLLDPPLMLLNQGHWPDLELRGTGTGYGQRTLDGDRQ